MAVYFIRAGETGPVKIGWAKDAEARRKQLQTSHHEPLRVIRTIEAGRKAEVWLQDHFAAWCLHGEWFQMIPEMLIIEPPELGPARLNWRAKRAVRQAEKAAIQPTDWSAPVSWAADRCTIQRPCTQCLGLLPDLDPEYLYWTTPLPHRDGVMRIAAQRRCEAAE